MAARDMRSACKSVLATMNSMPSIPASIIRFTALLPPPPTPMTLILASLRASSLKLMRISFSSFSFFMCAAVFELTSFSIGTPFLGSGLWAFELSFRSICMHYSLLTTHSSLLLSSHFEQRSQPRAPAVVLESAGSSSAVAVIDHSDHSCEFGLSKRGRHFRQWHRPSQPQRTPQNGFRGIEDPRH